MRRIPCARKDIRDNAILLARTIANLENYCELDVKGCLYNYGAICAGKYMSLICDV